MLKSNTACYITLQVYEKQYEMMKDKQKTAELIRIAGPAVLESVVTVVIITIDTKMISGLGKPAISAVALTTQPKLIIFAIFFALGTTASILVAQAYFFSYFRSFPNSSMLHCAV